MRGRSSCSKSADGILDGQPARGDSARPDELGGFRYARSSCQAEVLVVVHFEFPRSLGEFRAETNARLDA
jgi:hypothetical protein